MALRYQGEVCGPWSAVPILWSSRGVEYVLYADFDYPGDDYCMPPIGVPMKPLHLLIALPLSVAAGVSAASAQSSPHGDLRIACTQCHTTSDWKTLRTPILFAHDSTGFPLHGQHASVACVQCHKNLVFNNSPERCASCHSDIHRGELGVLCERCHTPTSWLVPDMRQRHAQTRFPLIGAHMTVPCQGCHINEQKFEYVNVSADCYGCHRAQFEATSNPPHRASGLGTNCIECHSPVSIAWGGGFDHNTTGFPLSGAHAATACTQCHPGGRFTKISTQCDNCHDAQFMATTNPPHATQGFSKDCQSCHTTASWQPATFDHSKTSFPLTGAHVGAPCAGCHTTMPYSSAPTACVGCHQQNYNSAANPPHAGFSTDCTSCHTTTAWQPATFDHSKTTFPLTGAHLSVSCASCHVNNNFTTVPATCVGCHQQIFNTAANPPHSAAGFSTDCATCHTTATWQPSTFDHGSTKFPLTGAHTSVSPCTTCHTVSPWTSQSMACVSCHQSAYNTTTNPNHASAGFPTACETCHTTTAWTGATFNHTWFPQSHGNSGGVCATCHTNANDYSVYSCVNGGCHPQATTDSHHTAVGGYSYNSTACYKCHPQGRGG